MFKKKKFDTVIQGINSIISKNRRSFSDQEIKVLEDCVILLQGINETPNDSFWFSKEFEQVAKLLIRILANDQTLDFLKDWI